MGDSNSTVTQDRLIYVRWSDDGQHIRKWAREPFAGATAFANAGNGAPLGPFDADDHCPVAQLPFALRSIAENIHVQCADHVLEDMVRIVTDAASVIEDRHRQSSNAVGVGVDALVEHFPTGVRGLYDRTAGGFPVQSHVGTNCACGWCTAATDEHEVRHQWAEHVLASLSTPTAEPMGDALTPSALSVPVGDDLAKGLRTSQKALDEIARQEQANIAGYLALRDFPVGSASGHFPPDEVGPNALGSDIPSIAAQLLEISRISNKYDLRECIEGHDDALGDSYIWRDLMDQCEKLGTNPSALAGDAGEGMAKVRAILEQARDGTPAYRLARINAALAALPSHQGAE